MICYICGEMILDDEDFFYVGKSKQGEKLFRHDDKKHEEIILREFKRTFMRGYNLGEQVG